MLETLFGQIVPIEDLKEMILFSEIEPHSTFFNLLTTTYFFLYQIPFEAHQGGDQKWRDRHALATVHYRVISLMSRSTALDGYAALTLWTRYFKKLVKKIKKKISLG